LPLLITLILLLMPLLADADIIAAASATPLAPIFRYHYFID
jgi:hypothetical protein